MSRISIPIPRLLPLTIAAMFGLLMLKSGNLVLAATAEPPKAATEPAKAAATTPPVAPNPAEKPAAPAEQPVTDSERALLNDLRQRRQQLDAREQGLAAREATLAAVTTRLDARFAELTALQSRLEALEAQRTAHDEANWRGLVKIYEAMKPRDAATIFNDLDPSVLLPVLDRMKEAKAALVLSAMQPDRARTVTAELAKLRARNNSITTTNAAPPAKSGG